MFRFKILQVRLEHSKEKIDIVGRLRDFENALVSASRTGICLIIRKSDPQRQLARDEINRAQPERELLEKPAEDEEQRLGGLDLVIELKTFVERFRRLNKFEQAIRGSVRPFPKCDGIIPKPRPQFFFI